MTTQQISQTHQTYQVALAFEDGVTRFITCAADQTVADASYRSRINIPLDCRDGACGTCKAQCESGDYDGGYYLDDALSPDEADAGFVLPCSMKPLSDLVLQIASTSAVAKTQAATYAATVTGLERLSPTTVALTLATPERDKLAFLPGQYVNIAVPGTDESRSYSFSNGPADEELTFLVKLTPGGAMSDYLTERAAVGDELSFTGPHGSFFLREAARPVLLLAGGTGLAPILAIVRALRESGSTRPVHLVYGVSTDDDLVELETLAQLADEVEGFTWEHCVSDAATTAANRGYVMSLIRPEHLYDGDVAVYLCGPPPMVESVRKHFADAGVEPTGFYYEKFALSGTATAAFSEATPEPTPELTPEPTLEPATTPEPAVEAVPEPVAHPVAKPAVAPVERPRQVVPASRMVGKQQVFGPREVVALNLTGAAASAGGAAAVGAGDDEIPSGPGLASRVLGSQTVFADRPIEALVAPAAPAAPEAPAAPAAAPFGVTPDGYEIGEEHPSVHESDAIFEARQALELGALELTLGRLSSQQIAGYRLLAESTVPYVDGDRFVDAAAYTETNAAFHDYLFTLTGNQHLLQAYQALGVKGHMAEVLAKATWCHPRCAQDHLDIVAAIEAGDRAVARRLIVEHADRSKLTMRRAMDDADARQRRAYVTPGRFDGQVVVVTGAAQGIGERTARRISAEGGKVVLADRADLVSELARELTVAGRDAIAVLADLETWEGATAVVEAAVARHGRVDVMVNNVGGAIWFMPFTEFSPEQIQAEITRSLMTTLFSCRAVLPGMVERGGGVIVNVSSAATRGIHRIPYSAAKGGINAITASLALEYAPAGVRVVATAPGGTEAPPRKVSRGGSALETEQEQEWFQAHIDQTVEHSLLKRYGTLDEQAAAIAFLASPEASYITGTVLPVAGGDLG